MAKEENSYPGSWEQLVKAVKVGLDLGVENASRFSHPSKKLAEVRGYAKGMLDELQRVDWVREKERKREKEKN